LFAFCRPLSARWKWLTLGAVVLLIGAYAELRALPGPRDVVGTPYGWPFSVRCMLMFRALGDYARLMFFPANLHMERTVFDPAPLIDSAGRSATIGLEYLSVAGLAILAAFCLFSWRKGRGQRARIFGASWFIVAYLPISNLFDLNATVAEHWLYLPSVGFIIFVIGCAVDLPRRFYKGSIALAAVAVIALAARSAVRSSDWVNDMTFYERTLAAGGSSSRVLGNLAQLYSAHGNYAKAEAMFREALKMCPDYPMARNNLAEVLARQGKKKEAEALIASTSKQTEQTRNEYPRTWIPVMNHALYRENDKDNEGALAIAEKARHDYPGVWEIIRFEANLLHDTRGAAAGVPLLEEFTRDHWWHHDAAVALGRLYAETGEEKKAEAILRHASWLDVYDAEALSALAEMRVRDNRLSEACVIQKRAVARQPDQPRQYILLSNIFDKMGLYAESKAALAEVSRLRSLAGIPDGPAKSAN
jgi:tetratricopeptide (TPR) repeat protein